MDWEKCGGYKANLQEEHSSLPPRVQRSSFSVLHPTLFLTQRNARLKEAGSRRYVTATKIYTVKTS